MIYGIYCSRSIRQPVNTPAKDSWRNFLSLVQRSDEGFTERLRLFTLDRRLTQLGLGELSSVRVESEQNLFVLERILLLHYSPLGHRSTLDWSQNSLYFRAVDQLADIWLADDRAGEEEIALECRGGSGGAIDLVEGLEGRGGPDDETSKVTARSKLEKAERVNGRGLNTRDVAEGLDDAWAIGSGVVDDERAAALTVTATT